MPVKGIKEVNQKITALLKRQAGPVTEQTMMAVLIEGGRRQRRSPRAIPPPW